MRRWLPVAAAFLMAGAAWCQELPELEVEADSEELAELLHYLEENPLDLNRATAEELMLIPWLSPAQALRIRAHLKGRRLADPSRLVAEGVIDQAAFQRILPYIYIEGKTPPKDRLVISSRWQRAWSRDTVRVPSPWTNRQRLEYLGSDRWRAFLQTQKDKGEGDWADYWSGAAGYRGGSFDVIAGDFQLRSGLGLAFGGSSPRIVFPGSFPKPAVRTGASIHTSSNERSALRGAAASGRMGKLEAVAAVSSRLVDGRTDSSGSLVRIYDDGYHRTEAELARKNNTGERLGVLSLGWEPFDRCWVGALGYAGGHNPGFAESLVVSSGASLSGGMSGGPGYLSFELTATGRGQGAFSALAGARISGTETALLVYAYRPDYRAPRFNGYERYGGRDEQGAAVFQKSALPARTWLSTAFHWYRPWSAVSTVDKGHGGYLLDLKADNGIIKDLDLACRWRYRETERACPSGLDAVLARERSYLAKAMLDWRAGGGFLLSADYAASRHHPAEGGGPGKGEMLSAGAGWQGGGACLVRIQSSFFNTESYYSAVYQPEPELRNTGSFHPLFGSGRRDALLVRYTYAKRLSAELKLAYTYREYQGETARQAEMGLQMEIK